MRNSAALLITLISSGLLGQTVRVPFVGCPVAGQLDLIEAPKGTDEVVRIVPGAAKRLAFYSSGGGFGVLAPRGWYCFGLQGSSGGPLFVSPQPINAGDLGGMAGPAVELEAIEGGGSGTTLAAEVWARVFPAQWPLVRGLMKDFPEQRYVFGPFPDDKLITQRPRLVRFQTPPRSEGLGTMGHLKPNGDPIDGAAILEGHNPDLLMLRVRLPHEERDLAPVILKELLVRQRRDAR